MHTDRRDDLKCSSDNLLAGSAHWNANGRCMHMQCDAWCIRYEMRAPRDWIYYGGIPRDAAAADRIAGVRNAKSWQLCRASRVAVSYGQLATAAY